MRPSMNAAEAATKIAEKPSFASSPCGSKRRMSRGERNNGQKWQNRYTRSRLASNREPCVSFLFKRGFVASEYLVFKPAMELFDRPHVAKRL